VTNDFHQFWLSRWIWISYFIMHWKRWFLGCKQNLISIDSPKKFGVYLLPTFARKLIIALKFFISLLFQQVISHRRESFCFWKTYVRMKSIHGYIFYLKYSKLQVDWIKIQLDLSKWKLLGTNEILSCSYLVPIHLVPTKCASNSTPKTIHFASEDITIREKLLEFLKPNK